MNFMKVRMNMNTDGHRIFNRTVAQNADLGRISPTAPSQLTSLATSGNLWRRAWAGWQRLLRLSRHAPRRLRLCESLPLGEKRFVAVVEFEHTRFLLGGTSTSLILLAPLGDAADEVMATQPGPFPGGQL